MTKILIILVLILLSPIILILSVRPYQKLVEPILMELKYAPNQDKNCTTYAKSIRFKVGDSSFNVPASYFRRASLRECWGDGLFGTKRGCTKNYQSHKGVGYYSGSFCQNPGDRPFILDNHEFEVSDGSITFQNLKHKSSLKRYCKEIKSFEENLDVKFFGNPVSIGCSVKNESFNQCYFTTFINHETRVVGRIKFTTKIVSLQDKISYFKGLEAIFSERITNIKESTYPQICGVFNEGK